MRLPSLNIGKVAIVGGGYAGLLASLKLSQKAQLIHVFDGCNVGEGGASAVSAGLIQPLSPKGRVIMDGLEGYAATKAILKSLPSPKPFYSDITLVRPLSRSEIEDWSAAAKLLPDWIELSSDSSTAILKKGIIVDSPLYLKTLWNTICERQPLAEWKKEYITDIKTLSAKYDTVVLTAGVGITNLWHQGLKDDEKLAIQYVRGQILVYDIPNHSLANGFFSEEYILPTVTQCDDKTSTRVMCGTTYEYLKSYNPTIDNKPNISVIETAIRDKICTLLPELKPLKPISCLAGVRAVSKRTPFGRIPMIGKHPDLPNTWMLGSFGSKGLVYHALTADILAEAIINNDSSLIPDRYRVRYMKHK